GVSCRQCDQCVAGRDNYCRKYTLFGTGRDGGNTELIAVPEYSAIQIPDDLTFEDAAAAPLVFLTAWHMLMGRAMLQPGEDVLVEHVGTATWQKSLESLAAAGRVVTCGATTGFDAKVDLRFLFSKQWSLLGSFMGTMGELHQVLKFVFRKQLKPVIDRVYPLAEIRAAHEHLENKEQFGKVILKP